MIKKRPVPHHVSVETPRRGVSTTQIVSTTGPINPARYGHKIEWQPNSLGSIMNQFKSICTKRIRLAGNQSFQWQPRYYDRIIRTTQELYNVRQYIINNPRH